MQHLPFGISPSSAAAAQRASKLSRLALGLLWLGMTGLVSMTTAAQAEGPRRVADLAQPDRAYSDAPAAFGALRDRVVFSLNDTIHGEELWITDGTEAGTHLFQDLSPGRDSSYPQPLGNLPDGRLFFSAGFDFFGGRELWITDGSVEGTQRLAIPCPGCLASLRGAVAGEILIFGAADPEHGFEPWRSDGTPEGTFRIGDLRPGPEDSSISEIVPFGDRAIFRVFTPETGSEPWVSDGTTEGTVPLGDLCPGVCSSPALFLDALGDRVYGTCSTYDCAFSTDGTPEGTGPAPLLAPEGAGASNLRAANGRLFFRTAPATNPQIWTSDGSQEGTRPLLNASSFRPIGEAGDLFYFQVNSILHATDGTAEGTRSLPGAITANSSRALDGRLVFSGPNDNGGNLWITDGTPEGSEIVREFPRVLRGDAFVRELSPRGDELAFLANRVSGFGETSIWETDGESVTLFGTGDYRQLAIVGDQRFVLEDRNPLQIRLSVVEDQGPSLLDTGEIFFLDDLTSWNDSLVFGGMSPGQQLWTTDGSNEGTRVIAEILEEWSVGCSSGGLCPRSTPGELTVVGDRLYFSSYDSTHGYLWRSAGTAETTELIRSFPLSETNIFFSSAPFLLRPMGESLFFLVGTPELGIEPWISDGTPGGTRPLADLTPGPERSSIREATTLGDRVVFSLNGVDSRTGEDLLIAGVDGVELLLDPGPTADIHEIVRSGERLYLAIDTLATGRELWISDGTPEGTRLLDLRPGPADAGVANLSPIPGGVFFAATDGATGLEPWVSFGNLGNTGPLADLHAGENASSPSAAVVAGDKIYFEADDGIADRELFVTDLADLLPSCPSDHVCLRNGRFAVRVDWRDFSGGEGIGHEVTTSDTSILLWFFEEDNWEMLVKVLDGCSFNGHYWVFAAAATDVEYTLEVTDLLTGETWSRQNPLGQASPAITATEALPTCP